MIAIKAFLSPVPCCRLGDISAFEGLLLVSMVVYMDDSYSLLLLSDCFSRRCSVAVHKVIGQLNSLIIVLGLAALDVPLNVVRRFIDVTCQSSQVSLQHNLVHIRVTLERSVYGGTLFPMTFRFHSSISTFLISPCGQYLSVIFFLSTSQVMAYASGHYGSVFCHSTSQSNTNQVQGGKTLTLLDELWSFLIGWIRGVMMFGLGVIDMGYIGPLWLESLPSGPGAYDQSLEVVTTLSMRFMKASLVDIGSQNRSVAPDESLGSIPYRKSTSLSGKYRPPPTPSYGLLGAISGTASVGSTQVSLIPYPTSLIPCPLFCIFYDDQTISLSLSLAGLAWNSLRFHIWNYSGQIQPFAGRLLRLGNIIPSQQVMAWIEMVVVEDGGLRRLVPASMCGLEGGDSDIGGDGDGVVMVRSLSTSAL
ncbi:hypothetical protein Tco_0967132 [Tanacetum coccineum]